MAKKKKRPRHRPPSAAQTPTGAGRSGAPARAAARGDAGASGAPGSAARGGANLERRERKEEARRLRRTVTSIGIAAAAVAAITMLRSFGGPNDIPEPAIRAAERAGCTEVEQPASSAPSGQHLTANQPYEYTDTPATSGFHDPSPLPEDPKVYDAQPPETRAVHSLEHGAVFVYYRPEADGGIPQATVDRLAQIAEGSNATFLAPYPSLTAETALTLTAWNRRQSCPAGDSLDSTTAATIVNGFVTAFECTGNAPESSNAPC